MEYRYIVCITQRSKPNLSFRDLKEHHSRLSHQIIGYKRSSYERGYYMYIHSQSIEMLYLNFVYV